LELSWEGEIHRLEQKLELGFLQDMSGKELDTEWVWGMLGKVLAEEMEAERANSMPIEQKLVRRKEAYLA
jgi:hypothetical protein